MQQFLTSDRNDLSCLLETMVKKFCSDVSYDKLSMFKNGKTSLSLFTLKNSRLGSLELNNTGSFELLLLG